MISSEELRLQKTIGDAQQRLLDAGFKLSGTNARSSAQSYGILRVALRNALFRVTDSDTDYCPSRLFRMIESGELGVSEATDALEKMLTRLGDDRWTEGLADLFTHSHLSEAG